MRLAKRSAIFGIVVFPVFTSAILALSCPSAVQAEPRTSSGKQTALVQATPLKSPPAIDIKVETFRKQIVPESLFGVAVSGVMADITNNSSAPVYMRTQDVHLVPPDVSRPDFGIYSSDGWFPTEYLEPEPHVISLKPNETYRIFWEQRSNQELSREGKDSSAESRSKPADVWQWVQRKIQFIGFPPGSYPITVEVKYWDHRKFDGDDYHTAVSTKIVEYTAPQWVIILGAILGGLIFTALAAVRAEQGAVNRSPGGRWEVAKILGKIGMTVIGSILLSVIITILMSRIAETQFFIKVTVSDFYGAIAVGFLANYGGLALLDKILPGAGKGGAKASQTEIIADSASAQATTGTAST